MTEPRPLFVTPNRTVYTLTRIYLYWYMTHMESVFEVLAERNRRAILQLLLQNERSVNELERELHRPQPSISKHLRVLREAGLVESRTEAQRRMYRLRPERLEELDRWLEPFRRLWTKHLDALEDHLDQMPDEPTKEGAKR